MITTHILKKDLKYIQAKKWTILFVFIIVPLGLGLLYGSLYQRMLSTDLTISTLPLKITDLSQSKASTAFLDTFKKDLPPYIQLVDDLPQNATELVLEKDFEEAFQAKKLQITLKDYGEALSSKYLLEEYLAKLNTDLSTMSYSRKPIPQPQITMFDQGPQLKSRSYMLMTCFIALSLFIAIHFASLFLKEKALQVYRRLASMPTSPRRIFFGSVTSIYLITFVICLLYYQIGLKGIAQEPLGLVSMLLMAMLQAFVIAGFYAFFIGFFSKERTLKLYSIVIFFVISFLGGSFYPIEQFENARKIALLTPNYNLFKILESLIQTQSLTGYEINALSLLAVSMVMMLIGALTFKLQEV